MDGIVDPDCKGLHPKTARTRHLGRRPKRQLPSPKLDESRFVGRYTTRYGGKETALCTRMGVFSPCVLASIVDASLLFAAVPENRQCIGRGDSEKDYVDGLKMKMDLPTRAEATQEEAAAARTSVAQLPRAQPKNSVVISSQFGGSTKLWSHRPSYTHCDDDVITAITDNTHSEPKVSRSQIPITSLPRRVCSL